MQKKAVSVALENGKKQKLAMFQVHTLVIGSGAAGLNAAVQLNRRGVKDVVIVTEGLKKGTSINTGSDKQTYYKLAMCGTDADAPGVMAESYFAGGSMHGDLSLIEAALSPRAFLNLVNLGVPFPTDKHGQFVGYKTDHDPRQRATSIGPYTSREMCRALIREIERLEIPVHEGKIAVSLLTTGEGDAKRACGALVMNGKGQLEVYAAENVMFAAGGPGGLYKTSVYPEVHTGAIGVALMAGAKAQSLPESQYGLASIKFRWNVSGTYMQVIPRFVSTEQDGRTNPIEFLREYFDSVGAMNSMVFLKGYQWPFDSRKIVGGSSIVDILVYIETVIRKRRVYLDFRKNPDGFDFGALSEEARTYLEKSGAMLDTPIARLKHMNPGAIDLYKDHKINIEKEPLEIAVCAQHNNGGLAGNLWWESLNIKHLFPVGEVNGSHGVYRPGGSALNSGQVAGFRAAEYVANCYGGRTLSMKEVAPAAQAVAADVVCWLARCGSATKSWKEELLELQERMTSAGAHIRSADGLKKAVADARAQWERLESGGCKARRNELQQALTARQLCFAHLVYLETILFAVKSGLGSRGSSITLDKVGTKAHDKLGVEWTFVPENPDFRDKVLETIAASDGKEVECQWVQRRPLPKTDAWFETAWAAYRNKEIYK